MTLETIFNEFKNQGYPLDQRGRICINERVFNFMPAIEPWINGQISELFGNIEEQIDERLLVSGLILAQLTKK